MLFYKLKALKIGILNKPDDQIYMIDHTRAKQFCLNIRFNGLNYYDFVENKIRFIHKEYSNIEEFIQKPRKNHFYCYKEEFPLNIESLYRAIEKEENFIKEKYGQIYNKDYLFELMLMDLVEDYNDRDQNDMIDKLYFSDIDFKFIDPNF